jgi:hypothetical protein
LTLSKAVAKGITGPVVRRGTDVNALRGQADLGG